MYLELVLGSTEKIKYDIFDRIPWYRYYDGIARLTIGAITEYLHNKILRNNYQYCGYNDLVGEGK